MTAMFPGVSSPRRSASARRRSSPRSAFGFFSSLNAATTHYGTGPAPIVFGAGYLTQAAWWRIGFLISLVHLAIWLPIGFLWWKVDRPVVNRMTTTYRVAVIPGDGIGNEVTPAAMQALDACRGTPRVSASSGRTFPWGSEYYFEHGRMMPDDALDRLRPFDAIFFGAVGDPRIQDNVTLNGLLLPIRRGVRSVRVRAAGRPLPRRAAARSPASSPATSTSSSCARTPKASTRRSAACSTPAAPHEVAVQSAMFTRHGTERVIRFAFDLARRRNRKRLLTSVTKSNAQGFSMAFWDRVFADVAREYPDIRTESLLVDAACMDLVRRPENFDVIVASNLFGDILTDLSAAITGSLGLAPSANLNPRRTFPSMFEPVHGSAPDIAGRGIANPMATMLAGRDDAGVPRTARGRQALEGAVIGVLAEGEVVTRDLGGAAGTAEVTEAVLGRLR